MATIKWRGKQVAARMAAAAAVGVDRTMSECVHDAKRDHEYVSRDGFLEGSTMIIGRATLEGAVVKGSWGSTANYALLVEIGTSRIGPTAVTREQAGGGNMWQIPGTQPAEGITVKQSFTILPPGTMEGQEDWVTLHQPSEGTGPVMAARPFLRPAADKNYPSLVRYIREAWAS